ncbi:MAG TPA: hypothetical protein VHV30_05055 [Polyangiaceae bacterium]|nr:hypothetical protein [Polyangiaceae bacterium]
MRRWPILVAVAIVGLLIMVGQRVINRRPFPPDTTPEGAYLRVAMAVSERRVRDAFPYLETESQWASYTIRDQRRAACERVRASYPPDQAKPLLEAWSAEADAPDGADLFALLAQRRGWVARLDRDLSGAANTDIEGERATVVTGRGTRYTFRRRENGIWGLTMFTAELDAEAERSSRDLEVVQRAASDYDSARH